MQRRWVVLVTGFAVIVGVTGWSPAAGAAPLCSVTRQITAAASGSSGRPSVSADGTRIAFRSDADIGGGNPDGNTEIFLYDTVARSTTQITSTTGGFNFGPSISADGQTVAFQSD